MATLQQIIQPELSTYFATATQYDGTYRQLINQVGQVEFKKGYSPFNLGVDHFTENKQDLFANPHFEKALKTIPLSSSQKFYLAHTFVNGKFTNNCIHSLFTHIAGNMFPTISFEFNQYDGKKLEKPFVIDSQSDPNAEEPYDITILLQEQIEDLETLPNANASNISQVDKLTCAQFLADVHLNMLDTGALKPFDRFYEGNDKNYNRTYKSATKNNYKELRNLFATTLNATQNLVAKAKIYDTAGII